MRSGHASLSAIDIKTAAEVKHKPLDRVKDPSERRPSDFGRQSGGGAAGGDAEVVRAATVTIPHAQKMETVIQSLEANMSYDVYFVAEVIGSNGVFGPVQSVLTSTTHPKPPVIDTVSITPANATADEALVRMVVSTPGRVYIALRPSGEYTAPLTHEELSASRSLDVGHQPVFALHDVGDWGQLAFNKSIVGLLPSTIYDAFIVAEAPGGGNVRGEMVHLATVVRTHSLPPELRGVRAAPKNGTAFALDVSFQLEFHPQDLLRVTPDALPLFGFNIYYEAIAVSSGGNSSTSNPVSATQDAASAPKSQSGKTPAKEERMVASIEETGSAVRGKVVIGNFSTVEQLQYEIAQPQVVTVGGLANGTKYQVTLVAETVGSNGLFGLRKLSSPVSTHDVAPVISSAVTEPSIGSVHAITVKLNMSRPGNIHYAVMKGRTPSVHELLRAASISQIRNIVNERGQLDEPAMVGFVGLEDDKSRVMTNGSERATNGTYSRSFQIGGLHDATHYSVVVMSETIGSFGVFGAPFQKILDVVTHENASEVELVGLRPSPGSTSSIGVQLRMSKASDVLFYCVEGSLNTTSAIRQGERCEEADRTTIELVHHQMKSDFRFTISNLTEDTEFTVSLFAESALRNRVYSDRSLRSVVRTHRRAPQIDLAVSKPVGGSTSTVETDVALERGCLLHYAARPVIDSLVDRADSNGGLMLKEAADVLQFTDPAEASRLHHSVRASITSSGRVFLSTDRTSFVTAGLNPNTTYELYIVTETSLNGDSSGVLSDVVVVNVTTYSKAPTLVKATAAPVAGTTDSVIIAANLSHPGIVHYFLSDADFADPAVIRSPIGTSPSSNYSPHTIRGEFVVLKSDIYLEIINGTNDTGPTDPPMYVKNLTLTGLKSGVTYHVSLTTETFDSDGVFGEFPPPILVRPHVPAPRIIPETLKVQPTASSSSSIDISMRLERFGEVHYALFFRGIIPDRSETVFAAQRAADEEERRRKKTEMIALGTFNASNYSDGSPNPWPPVSSSFNLLRLDGPLLKAARLEDLGVGVWENGSISVSREDVIKGKLTHKTLEKLPPNAVFDVCLVSETEGGSDVFNWNSSESDCHRVVTHADYTNQSVLFDEVEISPTPGRTDGIRVKLHVSKLPNAPSRTSVSPDGSVLLEGFTESTGRVPRFLLIDGKDGRRDLGHNSFTSSHRGREIGAAFSAATPGQAGVAATGTISSIAAENETFLSLEHTIYGLTQNSPYVFFFAYETVNSGGVFTKINPHKHRPNDSRSENDGIEITTHEAPPRLSRAEVSPTFGNASSVTVKFDIACDACDRAIVHILAYPAGCPAPSTTLLLPSRSTNPGEANPKECKNPLAKRKVKIAMPERQHSRKDVEEDISGNMMPNTSYTIFLATETVNSSGVVSEHFEELSVKTHAVAPGFRSLQLTPRKGSTTELLLQFELDGPGEVHFMLGESGNPEFNASSALNISSKSTGRGRHHKSGPNYHDYPRDVVRLRRSVKIEPSGLDVVHTEVLDYLSPGATYDAYVVVEAAGENGVYGGIEHFHEVSTFSNAPILLAHAANPTPGTTDSLTVGFRLDASGSIYFSVVSIGFWDRTHHVAFGSDKYGNRLAVQEKLVARDSMEILESTMQVTGPGSRDSGWREKTLRVPYAGANYTVYIVTETADSGGVYGIVAAHHGVQSHAVAPRVVNLTATATDARMDSLAIWIRLSAVGHVHYAAVIHGKVFTPQEVEHQSAAGIDVHRGVVNVNDSVCGDSNASDCAYMSVFEIESLKEGTAYDVYVRTETLNSFGVFGEWQAVPATARTHGLPPAVLHELECHVKPSCEALHRETVRYVCRY